MARMIPDQVPYDAPSSERRMFEALRELGAGWTAMHSVSWQSRRSGRQGDGEADFVLVSRAHGIVVVEVKGGRLAVSQGRWSTIDRHDRTSAIKNPFEQATHSKHALLAYLRDQGVDVAMIPLMHAVAFPDVTIDAALGPAATPALTWDREALTDLPRAVAATCRHWSATCHMSAETEARVVDLLAPTVIVRRRLVDEIGEAEQRLIELTDEQTHHFQILRHVRRALVKGGAGTGKTVLALERARRLAEDGFSVLLVCYNELLGARLAAELADVPLARAGTIHSLCLAEARRAGLPVPVRPDAGWWEHGAIDLLLQAAEINFTRYDAVVVDEGQDFAASWFESLLLLISDVASPPFYIFADRHQQLYRDLWAAPADMPVLELSTNCRSTQPIATRAAAIFGEAPASRGTSGPVPSFREASSPRAAILAVQRLAVRLVEDDGLAPESIVVLCEEAEAADRLSAMSAGETPFVRTGRGLRVETVRRFKGLEAEVVLLVLAFGNDDRSFREIAYTGMSRARSGLFVIGPSSAKRALSWP